jgi:hypothetical protein
MSIIVSYTCIPSDGLMLSEIDEFISIINEMKNEITQQKQDNPNNDYRLFITTEDKLNPDNSNKESVYIV